MVGAFSSFLGYEYSPECLDDFLESRKYAEAPQSPHRHPILLISLIDTWLVSYLLKYH